MVMMNVELYHKIKRHNPTLWYAENKASIICVVTVAYRGGLGCLIPPPEISKALQNRAKLNPICENC